MATQLIPATSSAPSLRELAAKAAAERDVRYALEMARQQERNRESLRTTLVERMSAVLGYSVTPDAVQFNEQDQASLDVDGVLFSLDFHELAGHYLTVALICARGCGRPLWVNAEYHGVGIDALAHLHEILQDTGEVHSYDCVGPALLDGEAVTVHSQLERAQSAIAAIEIAGERVATSMATVQVLEDERPLVKADCIREMIGTPNTLGKPGAVHSASSAADVIENHGKYWSHRSLQRDAEVEKHRAWAAYEAAKLTAELQLELYRSWERNR